MISWTGIFREAARRNAFLEFGTGGRPRPQQVEPGAGYLSILLRSAQLTHARRGLDRFHAVVHSVVTLPSDLGPAQFSTVVAPPEIGPRNAGRTDRYLQSDHRLLGPVPYIGGALEIQVGLFAVPSSELAQPYISLLHKLGEQAGLPFVSAAQPFVEPLVQGINLLAGGGRGSVLEIGLDLTQSPARQSRVVVLRTPQQEAVQQGVALGADGVSLVDGSGRMLQDQSALILEVLVQDRRPDWPSIPELASAFERVRQDYRLARRADLDRSLEDFRRIAMTCVDLLPRDRRAAVSRVQREISESGPPNAGSRGDGSDARELHTLDQLANLDDVDAAG